ncbi:MAG: hypothetical protein GX838_06590 [Clostridiaceae bacterium]|jgi:hypothetical protein|nr:hypothetical protein [Clostridiaceae bacterium]
MMAEKTPQIIEVAKGSYPDSLVFFLEDCPQNIDLMSLSVDEDIFGGQLAGVVRDACHLLGRVSSEDVLNILRAADCFLGVIADDGDIELIDQDEGRSHLDRAKLKQVTAVSLLWHVAPAMHQMQFAVLGDDGTMIEISTTTENVCAAFALAQAAAAIRYGTHPEWLCPNGGYHAMQAAQAVAIAKVAAAQGNAIKSLVVHHDRSEQMRRAAEARWIDDPKALAMQKVKTEWQAMQQAARRYRTDAQFARDMMVEHGQTLSEGSIKNAITRWRKESSC